MRYTVVLELEAGGGYVATVPALPGCVSRGDTRDEVAGNIREAADLYIEDCIAAGDPVPTGAGKLRRRQGPRLNSPETEFRSRPAKINPKSPHPQ